MSGLMKRLEACVGRRVGVPQPARDPVNEPMIRHWCDAVGDRNPVYTDPAAAAESRHGGIVAPPTMLQAWTMRGLVPPEPQREGTEPGVLQILDEAGFTSVVATNCTQEYRRYLRPGDRLEAEATIASVSEEKRTALGPGHFVTQRVTYRDQDGEVVGTMDFRLLKFRPPAAGAEAPAAQQPEGRAPSPPRTAGRRRSRPAMNADTEFFWEGLRDGVLLVSRCAGCGQLRHPPEPMCPRCQSLEWERVACSGRGRVYSFVVAHHPPTPPFRYPHVVALIELEEGPRMVAELTGVAPDAVRIGQPVEAVFEPAAEDDDLVVPRFRVSGG